MDNQRIRMAPNNLKVRVEREAGGEMELKPLIQQNGAHYHQVKTGMGG